MSAGSVIKMETRLFTLAQGPLSQEVGLGVDSLKRHATMGHPLPTASPYGGVSKQRLTDEPRLCRNAA